MPSSYPASVNGDADDLAPPSEPHRASKTWVLQEPEDLRAAAFSGLTARLSKFVRSRFSAPQRDAVRAIVFLQPSLRAFMQPCVISSAVVTAIFSSTAPRPPAAALHDGAVACSTMTSGVPRLRRTSLRLSMRVGRALPGQLLRQRVATFPVAMITIFIV